MNPEAILYGQKYDWDVAKQVFQYAEKYYGMDELYFYDAPPASLAIPHPKTSKSGHAKSSLRFGSNSSVTMNTLPNM